MSIRNFDDRLFKNGTVKNYDSVAKFGLEGEAINTIILYFSNRN